VGGCHAQQRHRYCGSDRGGVEFHVFLFFKSKLRH